MIWLNSAIKARFLLLVQLAFILSSAGWGAMSPIWMSVVFPFFFAISGAALAGNRRWFFSYFALSSIAMVMRSLVDGPFSGVVQLVCLCGAFFLLFQEIVRHSFFRPGVLHVDRVLAGVTGYLAIGLFWFLMIVVTIQIDGAAFLNQGTEKSPSLSDQLYFSFVTLTTLGYGDIIPVSSAGKVVVMLATLSGALYLAVFISALIGGKHEPH